MKELKVLMDYVIPGSSNYCLEKMINDPQFENGIKQLVDLFKSEMFDADLTEIDISKLEIIRKFVKNNFRKFNSFTLLLAEIYYLDPDVRNNLGLDNTPPFPIGNTLVDFDINLLEEIYNNQFNFKHNI